MTGDNSELTPQNAGEQWDNEGGPGGASTPTPGLTAATTRPNRGAKAVPSIPRPGADVKTSLPNCPVCDTPAILWGRLERHGVTEANYVCANAHGWLTKWVTV